VSNIVLTLGALHPAVWVGLLIIGGTVVGTLQKIIPQINPNNESFVLYTMTIRRPMYDIGAKR